MAYLFQGSKGTFAVNANEALWYLSEPVAQVTGLRNTPRLVFLRNKMGGDLHIEAIHPGLASPKDMRLYVLSTNPVAGVGFTEEEVEGVLQYLVKCVPQARDDILRLREIWK